MIPDVPPSSEIVVPPTTQVLEVKRGDLSKVADPAQPLTIAPISVSPPDIEHQPQWSSSVLATPKLTKPRITDQEGAIAPQPISPQPVSEESSATSERTISERTASEWATSTSATPVNPVDRLIAQETADLSEPVDSELNADVADLEDDPDISEDDLGEIRILQPRELPPPPEPPIAQLLLQASAFASTNITGLEDPSDGGYPLGTGATLLLTPALGPGTRLIASAGGSLTRFPDNGSSNYNALDFAVGVQHQLNRETYGRIGWSNRQLYRPGEEQLSNTHSINLTVGRQDWFSDRLRLDSFYRLQAQFVDPDDFSRLTNTLGANLRYTLSPQVEGLVGYQLSLEDYTQTVRFDTKHRLRAGITYRPRQDLYVSGLVSYLLGSSSDSDVALDGLTVGLVLGFNLPLF